MILAEYQEGKCEMKRDFEGGNNPTLAFQKLLFRPVHHQFLACLRRENIGRR